MTETWDKAQEMKTEYDALREDRAEECEGQEAS